MKTVVIPDPEVLLIVEQMAQADAKTLASGVSSNILMERADAAVVREIYHRWKPCRIGVLCGPGNNGDDGYVIARLLRKEGLAVCVSSYAAVEQLTGDAAAMAERWKGAIETLSSNSTKYVELIVDALFSAGLSRPLDSEVACLFSSLASPIVTVDVPSGVDGNLG